MKQGEIWLVNFDPSIGHEFQKVRPAIVISADWVDKYSNLVTIMPITSQLDGALQSDIVISQNKVNGLFSDSIIKVTHISSFDRRAGRFIKKIGMADSNVIEKIKEYLHQHFAIK